MIVHDYVKEYAARVTRGEIVAGPSVRAACKRHFRDLENAGKKGWKFDLAAAQRVFDFFEECLVFREGQFEGRPFLLQPFQKFILGSLFGWKISDGTRRFRTFYGEISKGAGKSPLAAGVGLYLFCADDEAGAQVYFTAPTKDQAKKSCFGDAVGFVEHNPELREAIRFVGQNPIEALKYTENGSELMLISADGHKKSGFRPNCIIIDELHEFSADDSLIVSLRKGFKFRRNPLLFMITNSGFDRQSVCWREHEVCKRVLAGEEINSEITDSADATFAYICDLDDGDDPLKDEKCWEKTNPMLDIITSRRQLRLEVSEARAKPDELNTLLRLNFCVWTDAKAQWMSREIWEKCVYQPKANEEDRLLGRECAGGLDLSVRQDLSALVLTFPPEGEEGKFDALSWFWTPAEGILDRSKRDGAPYDRWAKEGFIEATPGPIVDYEVIAEKIAELSKLYKIRCIAYDAYNIEHMRNALDEVGASVVMKEHAQGTRMTRQTGFWMPGSIAALEEALLKARIRIWNNPVATLCAMSATTKMIDDQGNKIFLKQKSTRRIDGVVALAMSMAPLLRDFEDDGAPMIRFIKRGRRSGEAFASF